MVLTKHQYFDLVNHQQFPANFYIELFLQLNHIFHKGSPINKNDNSIVFTIELSFLLIGEPL